MNGLELAVRAEVLLDRWCEQRGWDRAKTEQIDQSTIVTISNSDKWKLRWKFSAEDARMVVEKFVGD